jgi:predicted transcriptional regulator
VSRSPNARIPAALQKRLAALSYRTHRTTSAVIEIALERALPILEREVAAGDYASFETARRRHLDVAERAGIFAPAPTAATAPESRRSFVLTGGAL